MQGRRNSGREDGSNHAVGNGNLQKKQRKSLR